MENQSDMITPIFERLQEYGKTSYELAKLRTVDKVVRFSSNLASRTVVILVTAMFFMFLSIGLAIWFGQMCGEVYLGFLCVAAFYGLVGVILLFFLKNWMRRKFSNAMIKNFLD
jgi:hypothetical protein